MSSTGYKPVEGKREEFRKYLEKKGVMDVLTKVLVSLYEEVDKPQDALEYIRDKLAMYVGLETYSQLKEREEALQAKITELEDELNRMKMPQDGEEGIPAEDGGADGEGAGGVDGQQAADDGAPQATDDAVGDEAALEGVVPDGEEN